MIQGGAAAGNSREWSLGDEHGRVMCGHDPGYLGGVTAVSSHGGELISGAWDSQLKVWDPLSGAVRRSIHVGNWIYGLSHCDHDPSLAVVACTGEVFTISECEESGIPLTSVVEEPEETNAQIATSCLSLDNLEFTPNVGMHFISAEITSQDGDLGCVEISVQGGTDGWMALCPQAEAKAVVYDVPTGKRLYRIPLPNISQASTRGALAMEAAAGNLGSPRSGGSAELLLFAGAFGVVVSDPRDKPTRPAARIPTPHDGHPTTVRATLEDTPVWPQAMRSAREGAGASVDLATGGANGTVCVWDIIQVGDSDELSNFNRQFGRRMAELRSRKESLQSNIMETP
eukprot:gene9368-11104_t